MNPNSELRGIFIVRSRDGETAVESGFDAKRVLQERGGA